MDDLEKQIDALDENKEYQKIVDLIEGLDESEQTYDIKSELGRAYNNLANDIADVLDVSEQKKYFYKALEVLSSIKDDEKKDKKLHYRLAYTYHSLGRYFDALEELEKSLSVDSEYDNSLELYQGTGAILCYFYFSNDKYSNDEAFAIRSNMEEVIQEKAFDFGIIIIGGAMGHSYSYIDFIAYDSKSFIDIGQKILEILESDDIGFSVFYPEAIKYRF